MNAQHIPTDARRFTELAKAIEPISHARWVAGKIECDAGIEVWHPPGRNRWVTLTQVSGEPHLVLEHVSYILATDTCTPMYEHMLSRVATVEIEAEDHIRVVLSKNHYAGD